MQVIESVLSIVKDLIPSKDMPNPIWISRCLVLLLSTIGCVSGLYFTLRDTPIGERYGFRPLPVVSQLSTLEAIKINLSAYSNMVRLREDQPSTEASFLFLGYDRQGGLSYLDKAQTVYLSAALSNSPFSPDQINELWRVNGGIYVDPIVKKTNECVSRQLKSVNVQRLKRAIDMSDADRLVICPISKDGRSFGLIGTFWRSPSDEKAKKAAIDEMAESAWLYTHLTETYINSQPNVAIKNG